MTNKERCRGLGRQDYRSCRNNVAGEDVYGRPTCNKHRDESFREWAASNPKVSRYIEWLFEEPK